MTTTNAVVRWTELLDGGHLPRFSLLCLGVWLHAADSLLVATVMPSAAAEIGGVAYINWTIALYELGSIVAGAAAGLFSLRAGLRGAFTGAAVVYAVGCAMSALAPDMGTMLAGRLLQGVGGGMLLALSFVALGRLFPERLWPRLIGVVSAVWGVSSLCGPLIGGLFASAGLWRGGFWAFAGQAVVLSLLTLWLLREGEDAMARTAPAVQRVPWGRLATLSLAILAIGAAGIDVALFRSTTLCIVGVVLLAVVVRWDGRRGCALWPPRPLDLGWPVGAGIVMVLALSTATVSFTVYGPLLMAVLYGTDPLTAGYMIAVESVAWSATAVVFSGAHGRGEAALIRWGGVMIAAGVGGFALTMPVGPLTALLPWAVLQGAGFGMAWAFIVRRVVAAAPAGAKETASSTLPTTQLIGYALGAAIAGIAANAAGLGDDLDPAAARAAAFWVFAAFLPIAALGVAAAWRLARSDAAAD
jgi:MFS family permease